ncbi:10962_t:CDS:1, partial [Scutellospora calospora]
CAIAQIDSSLIEGCPLRFKYTRLKQDHTILITDILKMLLFLYKETRLMYFKFEQDCAISLTHLSVIAIHASRLRCSSFKQYFAISII